MIVLRSFHLRRTPFRLSIDTAGKSFGVELGWVWFHFYVPTTREARYQRGRLRVSRRGVMWRSNRFHCWLLFRWMGHRG